MNETGRVLKPANENPWYVLMTLYGEQNRLRIDPILHLQNREAWNAWAGQSMTDDERKAAALSTGVTVAELSAWPQLKSDIEKRHREQTTLRNGDSFGYAGFPDAAEKIDLNGYVFSHHLVMSNTVFPRDAVFRSSKFEHSVFFDKAYFCGYLKFQYSKIYQEVIFYEVYFTGYADFSHTTFSEYVGFSRAKFSDTISFFDSCFRSEAGFEGVVFYKDASFTDIDFYDTASFAASDFYMDADFTNANFRRGINFRGTVFSKFSYFVGAKFGCEDSDSLILLNDCKFQRPANFRDAKFHFLYPNFSGTTLHDSSIFTAENEFWPRNKQAHPEQAKASCAAIRHNLGKQGLPEEEHFFFRREMGFAAQIGGWWQRLPYRVFGAMSDFGYSIQRPALWLFGLWLAVAMINHVVLQWAAIRDGLDYHVVQAFGLSFANQFPVFGLQGRWFSVEFLRDLNPWLKALGGVQTVLSLPLLFFFALGLRTRFRMR